VALAAWPTSIVATVVRFGSDRIQILPPVVSDPWSKLRGSSSAMSKSGGMPATVNWGVPGCRTGLDGARARW